MTDRLFLARVLGRISNSRTQSSAITHPHKLRRAPAVFHDNTIGLILYRKHQRFWYCMLTFISHQRFYKHFARRL